MTKGLWQRSIVALCTAVMLLIGGLGHGVLHAQVDTRPELRIGISGEGDTLDPAHFSLVQSFAIATNVFSGLVRYQPGTIELMPDLATHWEISEDGKTYTFHLRDDVVWHKGYGHLTAHDVVASYERILDPATASRWRGDLSIIENIVATDDYTVVFQLKQPNAAFLHTVAVYRQGMITHQGAVAEFGDNYGRHPIGTGAFEFESWTPGAEVVLKANDDYYLGRPKISRVRFIIIPDESVRMFALQRGEIDIAYDLTNPEMRVMLANDPTIELGEVVSPTVHGISLNTTVPPLNNPKVRQALFYAIDRDGIAEVVLGGMAAAAYSPLAPPYLGHTENVPRYEYDPDKARALLAEAGYPNGIEVTLVWLTTTNQEILMTIQSGWEDAGIRLRVDAVDGGTWVRKIGEGLAPAAWLAATRPDPHVFLSSIFHSDAFSPGLNFAHYSAVDDLIDAGGTTMDTAEREAIYAQIQAQMMVDLPMLPIYWPKHSHPFKSYVKGWDGRQLHDGWAFPISIEK